MLLVQLGARLVRTSVRYRAYNLRAKCYKKGDMTLMKLMRVLVVDDNPDMRSFVKIVLERAGFEAEVAADGRRALDLQRECPADVLITDIFMPEPDGLELIQQFKSRFPGIKVVAISGGGYGTKVNYLYVAAEIGAEAVLHKPFSTETLVRTLQELAAG